MLQNSNTNGINTVTAIIAVAVILIIVWVLARDRSTPPPDVTTIVPAVITTEVPPNGEPATVTEVKPVTVTAPVAE